MATEVEATEPEETPEVSEFQATLRAAMDRADAVPDEPVEDEEAEGEEPESAEEQPEGEVAPEQEAAEQPQEPAKPEAPAVSPEWIAEAVRLNVPRQVLRFARSNDEIREMIVEFGDQEEEAEAPPAPAFPISDDDFDATDPTHRALRAIWDENQQLRGDLSKITQSTTGLINERQRDSILAKEAEYDAGLDALNMPELGARGSQIRKDAWDAYEFFLQRNPGTPKSELAKRAVFATHPELLTKQATQKQLEAIKGQEQKTLGAGPSKPPAKKEPTPEDNFREILRAANRRAMARMR